MMATPLEEAMCDICAHRGRWHERDGKPCTGRVGSILATLRTGKDESQPCPCPGFREAPLGNASSA